MIRILILSGALALGLVAVAQADGFEPGFQGERRHRTAQVHPRRHLHHPHVVRHAYRRLPVAPGGLSQSPNVPLYNVPPRRFP